jgi:hypothetical protein
MQQNILKMQEFESTHDISFHLSIFCTLSLSSSTPHHCFANVAVVSFITFCTIYWFMKTWQWSKKQTTQKVALEMILVHENRQ